MVLKIWRLKQYNKYILTALLLVTGSILLFKSEWLGLSLFDSLSFPLGTIISWFTLILFSLVVYQFACLKRINKFEKYLKILLRVCVIISLFWGVVSFLLSGNWAFNFRNEGSFYIWIFYTGVIVFVPILVLLYNSIHFLFNREK